MSAIHRPGCAEPGWTVVPARAIPNLLIARCRECGCVELRRHRKDTR